MLNLHVYIFFYQRYLNPYDLNLPAFGYKVEPGVRFPARAHTPGTCSVGATRDLPTVSRHRPVVRISGLHPEDRGSNPRGEEGRLSMFIFLLSLYGWMSTDYVTSFPTIQSCPSYKMAWQGCFLKKLNINSTTAF